METKNITDKCIELSRDIDGHMDIESANILYKLVMLNGSKILDKFEEHNVTGKEIKFLSNICGSNFDRLSHIINTGFAQKLLSRVKESKYCIELENRRPKSILGFIKLQ